MITDDLKAIQATIERCLPKDRADLTFKAMFGGLMGYMQGRPFASLSNVGLAIKLPPDAQDELLKIPGAARLQYEADSTPSKQYIRLPTAWLTDDQALTLWLARSADHVVGLPLPKKSKAKK